MREPLDRDINAERPSRQTLCRNPSVVLMVIAAIGYFLVGLAIKFSFSQTNTVFRKLHRDQRPDRRGIWCADEPHHLSLKPMTTWRPFTRICILGVGVPAGEPLTRTGHRARVGHAMAMSGLSALAARTLGITSCRVTISSKCCHLDAVSRSSSCSRCAVAPSSSWWPSVRPGRSSLRRRAVAARARTGGLPPGQGLLVVMIEPTP
jgi:hypothetical protein